MSKSVPWLSTPQTSCNNSPKATAPLQQLSVLEHGGDLVLRLEDGELMAADGQLQLAFDAGEEAPPSLPLRIDGTPRTAVEWFEQGVEQEREGFLQEAAESHRPALLVGGPDAQVCFDLANVLHQLGRRELALERYRQVLELDDHHVDA